MGRQQGQPRTSEATESGPIMRYIAKTSALTNQPRIKPVMKSSYFVFLGIICWLIIFKSAIFFFQSRRTVYLHAIERKGAPSDNLLAFSSPLYPPQIKKNRIRTKKKKKVFNHLYIILMQSTVFSFTDQRTIYGIPDGEYK